MSEIQQTTASGRVVKRTGMNDSKKSALQKIREAREGGVKRTDQYEIAETAAVFEELGQEEYDKRQMARRDDDFIVDDEGFGYKDRGGEIWETGESNTDAAKKSKRRKLNKDEQTIDGFMFPVSGLQPNRRKMALPANSKKQGQKVDEAQSKNIMGELFNELDQNDADELAEPANAYASHEQVVNDQGQVAFSKQEEMQFKAETVAQNNRETNKSAISTGKLVPSANPFSKKRRFDEITPEQSKAKNGSNGQQQQIAEDNSMQGEEERKSAQSSHDVKMSAAAEKENGLDIVSSAAAQAQKKQNATLPNSTSNIEEDWRRLKQQNTDLNNEIRTTDAHQTLNSQDLPLPLNPDGSLSFFWIDAHEEQHGSEFFLFGKVWQPQLNQYVSCALKVDGMERTMYAIPKVKKARGTLSTEEENKCLTNVYTELEELRKRRFKDITMLKCKGVLRKYCFETPLEHGEHKILKIKFPATMPPLPANLTGNTFESIFGTQQSMLELFILKQKIKGPCWLTLKNVVKPQNYKRTWCKQEVTIQSPKDCVCTIDDVNKASPPLVSFTFSTKMTRSQHNTQEIAVISCIVQNKINQDGPTRDEKFQSFTLLRKLDSQPLPFDLQQKVKQKRDTNIQIFQNERQMLEMFINKLHLIDPDLLVSHNLCGSVIEVLLARISYLRINHWSRLGRMKRGQMPQRKFDAGFHSWVPRQVSCGRLLVDTFLNAKELIRETNYDLGHLTRTQLKKDRRDFDDELLPRIYQHSESIFQLVDHTETDSYLIFQLMMHLQIIPLTKQLTTIAGNLWFRSLQNARAERNEWLLMHEFYGRKFLCPDKKQLNSREAKKSMFGGNEADIMTGGAAGEEGKAAKKGGKRRQKAKYGGGLVLEPKAGFYDSIILLLDFNSLYPSIIQEYSLCFTTVNRRHSKNYDGSEAKALSVAQLDDEAGENNLAMMGGEEVELPGKTGTATKDAILPSVLKTLVEKRKLVKNQIKGERDPVKLGQLDIRQKALKLTANSMYGCLGFSSSRFHAQAIAALITRTGRETLMKTKEIAEERLGFSVVYGDTDSIMINTGTSQLQEALLMGKKLKDEVNCLYKCLEIEIDGVFKSLLLLKKKKYAALNVVNWGTKDEQIVKEVKGLDMVRRDWCQLSKNVGNKVLEEILSGKEREAIVIELNNYLSGIGGKMKDGTMNLSEYVITKQLTRAPSEYQDFKSLPHVIVADRLIRQGIKASSDLVNNFIGYIICKQQEEAEEEQKNGALAKPAARFSFEKAAFSFDEVMAQRSNLKPDVDWYIMQQLMPPITRLIQHIDGIEIDFVAQCLGVDPKKYKYHSSTISGDADEGQAAAIPQAVLKSETQRSLADRSIARLTVECPFCSTKNEIKGIFQDNARTISGIICQDKQCGQHLPEKYLKNRVTLFLRQLLEYYYAGHYKCAEPSCNTRTQQISVNQRCTNGTCKGKLDGEINERKANDTLRYIQGLFDVPKYIQEHPRKQIGPNETEPMTEADIPNLQTFNNLKAIVDKVVARSKYNKVDLNALFSFMDQ